MEIRASSSKPKGSVGQIVWLTVDRSSSLEVGCRRKVRFEEGAFQKGASGSRICRLAFCQVMGLASGYSVSHGAHTAHGS